MKHEGMKDKIKLFTWRQGVITAMAATAGIGLSGYRIYRIEGRLDAKWFVIMAITMAILGTIVFFVARHANRPERKD